MAIKVTQDMLDLYDRYAHGIMDRRGFLAELRKYAVGGVTVAALAEVLLPDYANAQQTSADDPNIDSKRIEYPSPEGAGVMGGLLCRPAQAEGPLPAVLVIHENRGLNPHIEDVARRAALEGFLVLAPDALFPLGGYPGNDDDGRTLQRQRDRAEMVQDFAAAVRFLEAHEGSTGKVSCVGFCFGGAVAHLLATRVDTLAAAVPFYGRSPDPAQAQNVNAALQVHMAGLDERVNASWPAYAEALEEAKKPYTVYTYRGANHGFHNDTTPRFDAEAAQLAWSRTVSFFKEHLI